jgi:branched-chain amino acid transport system ATP-binding protein
MLDPKVLLIDEPSIGLAPKARGEVFKTLASLADGGWTILLVEQNARSGLAVAQHGAVLDGGVVRLAGPASEVLANPDVGRLYLGVAS